MRSFQALYFIFGGFLCGILAKTLKRLIRQPRPTKIKSRGYGMPSSHSQVASFFATYSNFESGFIKADWSIHVGLVVANAIALSVIWSRVRLGHHSLAQVSVGTVIGMLFGYFWNRLWHSGYLEAYNDVMLL
jgi:dolichyldiphosphatase